MAYIIDDDPVSLNKLMGCFQAAANMCGLKVGMLTATRVVLTFIELAKEAGILREVE